MTVETIGSARGRHEEQRRQRLAMLTTIHDMCERGERRNVMPVLMANLVAHPVVKTIRLWQLDSVMFGTERRRACRTIRKMRETIHDQTPRSDALLTLGWAFEDRDATIRMTTWLWLLGRREHLVEYRLPDGFPYALLYEDHEEEQD